MAYIRKSWIVLVALLISAPINASPTSNEYIPCQKLAVAALEYCLNDGESECWSKSKADYESCRNDVIQQHVSDHDRIRKEKELREKLESNEK